MAEETQYTANTGFTTLTTANPNLDGSGTLGTVLTAASNGTLIKSITVSSNGDSTDGMVRLFIYDGTNTRLFMEIPILAVDSSSVNPRFAVQISLDFTLKTGYILKASTENTASLNVIAEGLDWTYYSTSVRTDTTQYTAVTGLATLSTSGTVVTVLTAGSNGCSVESITFKAMESPSSGLVAIGLSDGVGGVALISDIKVEAVTKSSIASSYEYTYVFDNDFDLKSGYSVVALTRANQLFRVTAEGLNWAYPA